MPSPKHLLIGPQVHQTQMGHVRKGCLSRPGLPAGVAADGSRIEASHTGWNSLQRAFSSGLPMMNALCHDFVLRRNMRILWQAGSSKRSTFVQSTQGSHHIRLVSHANAVWNLIKSPESAVAPVLRIVDSGERFGLVQSKGHFADLSYPKPGYILAVDGEYVQNLPPLMPSHPQRFPGSLCPGHWHLH